MLASSGGAPESSPGFVVPVLSRQIVTASTPLSVSVFETTSVDRQANPVGQLADVLQ